MVKKITGVICLLIGLALFVAAIWQSPLAFFRSAQTDLETQLPINGVNELALDVGSEDLKVVPSDDTQLHIWLTGRDLHRVSFSAKRINDNVKITLQPKWYAPLNANELSLVVAVPRKQRLALTAKTNSRVVTIGNKTAKAWQLSKLTTDISEGACNLNRLQIGTLDHHGEMSDLSIDNVNAKNATLDNVGNINMDHYSGPLQLTSTGGNVRLKVDRLLDDIHAQLQVGKLDIYLPTSAQFSLRAELAAGKAITKDPAIHLKRQSKQTTAKVGDGRYQIEAKIANGDLILH